MAFRKRQLTGQGRAAKGAAKKVRTRKESTTSTTPETGIAFVDWVRIDWVRITFEHAQDLLEQDREFFGPADARMSCVTYDITTEGGGVPA